MTGREDSGPAALDSYIRSQLAGAADTYASHVDVSARLELIRGAGNSNQEDGTDAADS